MRRTGLTLAAVASLVLAGCSPAMDDDVSQQLQQPVADAREAAEAGDPDGAADRLGELRELVTTFEDEGELAEDRAAEILAAADEVEARLDLVRDDAPAEEEPEAEDPAPEDPVEPEEEPAEPEEPDAEPEEAPEESEEPEAPEEPAEEPETPDEGPPDDPGEGPPEDPGEGPPGDDDPGEGSADPDDVAEGPADEEVGRGDEDDDAAA